MYSINCNGQLLDFSLPQIMGIINITPDSFYTHKMDNDESSILKRVEKMVEEGAKIIDIGGYSSRPNATHITEIEESNRVLPVIKKIRHQFPKLIISIDTFRSNVARAAILEGANIINDISAGEMDDKMIPVAGQLNVPYIANHMQGTPKTMQENPHYENLLLELVQYFVKKTAECRTHGIKDLIIDPGFGFGKTLEHNYAILKHLNVLEILNCPILVGISRKSMITKLLHITAEDALNASSVLHIIALQNGAQILRVHDVKPANEAIQIYQFMKAL